MIATIHIQNRVMIQLGLGLMKMMIIVTLLLLLPNRKKAEAK